MDKKWLHSIGKTNLVPPTGAVEKDEWILISKLKWWNLLLRSTFTQKQQWRTTDETKKIVSSSHGQSFGKRSNINRFHIEPKRIGRKTTDLRKIDRRKNKIERIDRCFGKRNTQNKERTQQKQLIFNHFRGSKDWNKQ